MGDQDRHSEVNGAAEVNSSHDFNDILNKEQLMPWKRLRRIGEQTSLKDWIANDCKKAHVFCKLSLKFANPLGGKSDPISFKDIMRKAKYQLLIWA